MYVELHAHSAFSFLDGASTPVELAASAAAQGYPAFALTDHDGVWGSMEFAHACRGFGVRAITGTELTVAVGPAGPVPDLEPPSLPGWSPKSAPPPGSSAEGETPRDEKTREVVIDPLTRFNRRADAIAARLQKLQQTPV